MEKRILVNNNGKKEMYFLSRFNETYPDKVIFNSPCFINGNAINGDIISLESNSILYNVIEDTFYYMLIQGMGQVQLVPQHQPGLFSTIEDALEIVYAEHKKMEGMTILEYIKDGKKFRKNIGFSTSRMFNPEKDELKNE